jgi:predicted phosphodiesterase
MPKAINGVALARKLLDKFPDTPSRTLAKKLHEENKARFSSLEAARSAIRIARGANGKQNRSRTQVTNPRPKGKAGWKAECPPSLAEPWLPVQIDGPCKVLSLSDVHIPYHSKEAVEAAVKYGKKLKPDVVLLNGDTMDFYKGSRFQHDPSKRSLTDEVGYGRSFLSWLRGQFPKARIIYKMGNHDERWDVLVWNRCVEMFDLDCLQLHNVLEFEQSGIERVGDSAVKMLDTCLIGHLHRSSSNAESDWKHNETVAWSQGCLCDLNPEYARVNRWNRGFCHIEVAKDNQFNLHNYRITSDYQVRTA